MGAKSEIYWAEGRRWERVRGTGTVLGLSFRNVNPGGVKWEGTLPLAGAWLLRYVWTHAYALPQARDLHAMELAVAEVVPASAAAMAEAEGLFPYGGSREGFPRQVWVGQRYEGAAFPLDRAVVFNGRRLIGSFRNGSTAGADVFIGVVADELTPADGDDVAEVSRPGIMGALSAAAAAARGS